MINRVKAAKDIGTVIEYDINDLSINYPNDGFMGYSIEWTMKENWEPNVKVKRTCEYKQLI